MPVSILAMICGLMSRFGCVALTGVTAGGGQGWSEIQTTPAATVNHVWNARFWLLRLVLAVTLVRE